MKIDQSDEAIERIRFMQRVGMASAGQPVGLIMGMPIVEVDNLPEDGWTVVPTSADTNNSRTK